MKVALNEAKKSLKHNDVPVGCVIVKNGKIISKAYNQREKKQQITKHAEIIAINKATKKLKNWHLDDCILYTSLKPCLMCTSVIIQSRIKKIIYALENEKNDISIDVLQQLDNNAKKIVFEKGKYKEKSLELLQKFFQNKRI